MWLNPELRNLIPHYGLILILGSPGSGKSVLGYGILDQISRETRRKAYVHGIPLEKRKYLPRNFNLWQDLSVPPENGVILYDEAYLSFFARDALSKQNRLMAQFVGLIRHRNTLAIYITQEAGKLDIALRRGASLLLIKPLSQGQILQDRSEFRPILAEAQKEFRRVGEPFRCCYVKSGIGKGLFVENSNILPSFWSEELSRIYQGVPLGENRRRLPKEVRGPLFEFHSEPVEDIIVLG